MVREPWIVFAVLNPAEMDGLSSSVLVSTGLLLTPHTYVCIIMFGENVDLNNFKSYNNIPLTDIKMSESKQKNFDATILNIKNCLAYLDNKGSFVLKHYKRTYEQSC